MVASLQVAWCKVATDRSAWVADPCPQEHLAVWRRDRGWAWHIIDRQGLAIVQG